MTGDEEVIQNLVKEINRLENHVVDLNVWGETWRDLYFEAKELISDYKNLLHSKEHSDER